MHECHAYIAARGISEHLTSCPDTTVADVSDNDDNEDGDDFPVSIRFMSAIPARILLG
jgi:hypothetical protein